MGSHLKIALVSLGTRGDLEPVLSLGDRLREHGHEVTIAARQAFAPLVEQVGCHAAVLPGGDRAEFYTPEVLAHVRRGDTEGAMAASFVVDAGRMPALLGRLGECVAASDLVISHPMLEDFCINLAEAHRVRIGSAWCCVTWPNSVYPSFRSASREPSPDTYISTYGPPPEQRPFMLRPVNMHREHLGLPPVDEFPRVIMRGVAPPVLYWVPPEVLPRPPELGDNHYLTGYWAPSPRVRAAFGEQRPPAGLEAFLAAGAPPVFVSFGSVPVLDAAGVELFIEAARALRQRLVIGRGWSSAVAASGADVLVVDDVDHDWLLPRCAAAIHHGGAGTTGAVVRAGIPHVVVPLYIDQPIWAQRVTALGIGARVPFADLAVAKVVSALEHALSPEVRERAAALAARLAKQEDGAIVAARLITEHPARFPIPTHLGAA